MRSPGLMILGIACLAIAAPAQLILNEVLVDPSGPDAGFQLIEIVNTTPSPVGTAGMVLSAQDGATLSSDWLLPAVTLAPSAIVRVHWLADGTNTATDLYTGSTGAQFVGGSAAALDADGALALFSAQPTSAGTILDFVQWGAGGHLHEGSAVTAGIWTPGDAVAIAPETVAIAYDGSGVFSSDWPLDPSPTFGARNPSRPGNGGDLAVAGAIFGNFSGLDDIDVQAGDVVTLQVTSPGGTLVGESLFVLAHLYVDTFPPVPLTFGGDLVPNSIHVTSSPLIIPTSLVTASGFSLTSTVPAGLGDLNVSVNVQAIATETPPSPFRPAGIVISDALRLEIQSDDG